MHSAGIAQICERAKQQPIDHTEHRRVCSDAECESHEYAGRISRRDTKAVADVANVVPKVAELRHQPTLSSRFPRAQWTPAPAPRGDPCTAARHAVGHGVTLELLLMKAQFLRELTIELVTAHPVQESGDQLTHGFQVVLMIRRTA